MNALNEGALAPRLRTNHKVASMKRSHTQRGFTLIEVSAVLALLIIALPLFIAWQKQYVDSFQNRATSAYQARFTRAVNDYIHDYTAAVTSVATATSPAVITVAMLKNTSEFSSSQADTNPYGQTLTAQVLQPVANKLEVVVVSTGGQPIDDHNLHQIAGSMGSLGSGGYISAANPGTAVGTSGAWQIPIANFGVNPGGGHLVTSLAFVNNTLVSDYLYRSLVAGHPEYNRMNTDLDMANNSINNINTVQTNTLRASGNAGIDGNLSVNGEIDTVNVYADSVYSSYSLHSGFQISSAGQVIANDTLKTGAVHAPNTSCSGDGQIAQGTTTPLAVCKNGIWVGIGGGNNLYVSSGVVNAGQAISVPSGYTNCNYLVTPQGFNYYDGGRNEPDGNTRTTYGFTLNPNTGVYGNASSQGYYMVVCTP